MEKKKTEAVVSDAGGSLIEQCFEFTRRHLFLNLSAFVMTLLTAGFGGFTLFRFLSPAAKKADDAVVEIDLKDLQKDEAFFFKYHNKPALLVSDAEGNYHALSAVCTHLGCIVKWQAGKKEFLCPCHGGRYDITGKVLSGPPPEPLFTIDVVAEGGKLYVGRKENV